MSLIVTVDCGITAVDEAEPTPQRLGVDVVVTDHHECKDDLPRRRGGGGPPPARLPLSLQVPGRGRGGPQAGAGPGRPGADGPGCWSEYADLAAIGTVADVMSLTGENRAIVAPGPGARCSTPAGPGCGPCSTRPGSRTSPPPTAVSVGYALAPRINASGRMGCAEPGGGAAAHPETPAGALALARAAVPAQPGAAGHRGGASMPSALAHGRGPARPGAAAPLWCWPERRWHQGVVGIVASRLAEKYSCPTFMICLQDGQGKGSCRSFGGLQPVCRPGALRRPAGGLRRP